MNAKGSPVAVWSNGSDSVILYRPYPKEFDDTLFDIPRRGQQLQITQHVYHQNCT
jgi:type I restriction enzyme M protein